MKIAIIGAMKKEITFLLNNLDNLKENKYRKFSFFEGNFNNHEIVVVEAGIGKVQSGILFSALVSQYPDLDLTINIGVSGGVLGKVDIGEVVVASKLKYADVDVTAIPEYCYGQIPDCPDGFNSRSDLIANIKDKLSLSYKDGVILTGDQFFSEKSNINGLIDKHFPNDFVLCFDMESTALAQGAWFYEIDYIAIRAISDVIGKGVQYQQYLENVEKACVNSNLFLLDVLKYIKK